MSRGPSQGEGTPALCRTRTDIPYRQESTMGAPTHGVARKKREMVVLALSPRKGRLFTSTRIDKRLCEGVEKKKRGYLGWVVTLRGHSDLL